LTYTFKYISWKVPPHLFNPLVLSVPHCLNSIVNFSGYLPRLPKAELGSHIAQLVCEIKSLLDSAGLLCISTSLTMLWAFLGKVIYVYITDTYFRAYYITSWCSTNSCQVD
jgi:hypothetical protein